ncbi:hypothetical protein EOE18_16305 [Novosphingobium umbonatum]|uniref:PepSY domain-containing protein n=1 Tax=Novosphingobium umbonatum TaxID=1908524 RepID=A0A437N0D1_9SPHN|nr:PepSY-associated TM helix domain-containing protein [Novosphingobium umbonatum]RVU03381.1 hypothetical protein EOE18_16305 [Novosphingobium umbonatum]
MAWQAGNWRITRQFWVVAHRWAGLTLALFLAVAGFTGIFLAWIDELEVAAAPQLQLAPPPHAGARPLSTLALREQVLARYPLARIDYLPLHIEEGRSLRLYLTWPAGIQAPDWDDLFLDPYTGKELGRRQWGNIGQGLKNLMPFVYRLHYSLALGPYGTLAFGLAALVWVVDCFVGFYLTLPAGPLRWATWRKAWTLRPRKSGQKLWSYKLNFDLHRAGGLWVWPLLLVFALSSLSFNLPQVYAPILQALGGRDHRALYEGATLPSPRNLPKLAFEPALKRGKWLAEAETAKAGLAMADWGESYLWYIPTTGTYLYGFTSSADISKHGEGSFVAFDSDTGRLRAVQFPTGQTGANTFTTWIEAIHTAHVGGMLWRMGTSLLGAIVTMLCITGVVIWMKKRSARLSRLTKG